MSALLTDMYQLTMLQAYWKEGMHDEAVFEFFVRKLPRQRNFLVAAGLAQALDYLEHLSFSDEEISWLEKESGLDPKFLDFLRGFRFTGDVWAMPEGTIFFPNEPVMRVRAPIAQAQLAESRLINILHYQILVASKAARCFLAAPEKTLVDFGLRRAHGGEAGLWAARASYLAGFAGTATTLAKKVFAIPIFGTMAHSYIEAHASEEEAFWRFALAHPQNAIFLIDTYDTIAAAKKVVALAPPLLERGIPILAVRLDSGDLAALSKAVREILDAGGLSDTKIIASGNLDEEELQRLLAAGAPIDIFGVGTSLTTSSDAPYLDCGYKLEAYSHLPRMKTSKDKATWPGEKQVWRKENKTMEEDLVGLASERLSGRALLLQMMEKGETLCQEPLQQARQRFLEEVRKLPTPLRALESAPPFPVRFSPALSNLRQDLWQKLAPEAPQV